MAVGEILYGARMARVALLDPDGGMPTAPVWKVIETLQQVNYEMQWSEGQTQEQRGGDRLLATVTDDDVLMGVDLTIQVADLQGEVVAIIDGGTWDQTAKKYTPPDFGTPRPAFALEVYAAYFGEGPQMASDLKGFYRFVFPYCKGRLDLPNLQDRNFANPQFTIRARRNNTDNLPPYYWEIVPSLPA